MADITTAKASLVSLNPVRDTLEDLFVRQVTSGSVQATDRWQPRDESSQGGQA